jgi:hypothetical protein
VTAGEIWLRGEGGAVFRMTPPLDPNIQQRWDAGRLERVNPDGSPWTGEEPAKRARKAKAGTGDDSSGGGNA